ncbi:F-box-like domain superfamily [Arabidopsis thaliana x Arabidopsis arenosa]|uniref:F-box-like domain superfamily n=1 Tax=Arabidopsis thaliana x Arabidopsis arenosa TaxID=1240361 RepID=A0A8T1XRH4_9BRAS|nr:F-box-like domain superfamily [Arabidopsis thaliana x Arabidopsis arenosa]
MQDLQPSSSRNLVHAENSTRTITSQILSRLPVKSLTRFLTVSKLWFSILGSQYFADLFLAQSKTRPRLLFTFKDFDSRKRFFFSVAEHQNDAKSSTIIARHDMTIPDLDYIISPPVNGFLCFTRGSSVVLCNPTAGHTIEYPDFDSNGGDIYARLGYDPFRDQYKVLCVRMSHGCESCDDHREQEHLVLSLKHGNHRWRKIKINGDPYAYLEGGICMNGVIYYGVGHTRIARFDEITSLCTGEIHTNEVVVVSRCLESSKHFCVYYVDMMTQSIRRVEIDGMADNEFRRIHGIGKNALEMLCFPGHVEHFGTPFW